jgi:carbohydrate binding protein with CBM4/9 domain
MMAKLVKQVSIICSVGFLFLGQSLLAEDKNILINGDFSNETESWLFQTKESAAEITLVDGVLKFSRKTPKIFSRIYQDIRVVPGAKYKFSFRAKPQANARYKAWVNFGNKKQWQKKTVLFFQKKPSTEWIDVHETIDIPDNINKIRINLGVTGGGTHVLFDNISLKQEAKASAPAKKSKL